MALMEALLEAVHLIRGRTRGPRPVAEAQRELVQLRHVCDLLELEFASVAAEVAESGAHRLDGSASAVDWIRHTCRMSHSAAARSLGVGVHAGELPLSVEAVERGDIGFDHLSLLASTASAAHEAAPDQPFDERPLLASAVEHSVGRFRHDCANARHELDAAAFLRDHLAQRARRTLELRGGEGGVIMQGFFDGVGGATVRQALEPLAVRGGADDHRTRGQRLADALVELAMHGLSSCPLDGAGSPRAVMQVTASIATLEGAQGASAAELLFAGPVPAAAAQRLACDASINRVVFDSDSTVVDVGRARRFPSGATRRALQARDRGCVWPGCDRPANWTAAHHLVHWTHGGETDLDNLVLLCYRHHWQVHEGGWSLVRSADRGIVAVPPLVGEPPPQPSG